MAIKLYLQVDSGEAEDNQRWQQIQNFMLSPRWHTPKPKAQW